VTAALRAEGRPVRVVGRSAEKLAPLVRLGAEPRAGAYSDSAFLEAAFDGADMAFVLTPVDVKATDVNAVQYAVVDALVAALRASRVRRVVLLSSWGAELTKQVGGILACHRFEQQLEAVPDMNVVHLRPVWFMENFLFGIPLIRMAGVVGLAIGSDVRFPMISARDIAPVATSYLADATFRGKTVRYLNGDRDLTMVEVARALGEAVGRPDLGYVEMPLPIFRRGLASGGLTPNAAELLIEINRGIHDGVVRTEPRDTHNTTPTSIEAFAREVFAPAFAASPRASVVERAAGVALRSYLAATGNRVVRAGAAP